MNATLKDDALKQCATADDGSRSISGLSQHGKAHTTNQ
jgi:hypothetical protein